MRASLALAAFGLVAACALAGCTMGPDFQPPNPPKAQSFLPDQPPEFVAGGINGGEAQRIVDGLDIPGQWWQVFQSPQLNGLIETALRANPDIQAASAGMRVAQEAARAQRATLFPTVSAGFGASANQVPTVLSAPTADNNYSYSLYTLGLTLSYNLDLWGANRRQIELLDALAEAQCFQLEGAYLSLASNVVAAAILEASLRAQIEATQRIIAAQRDTLDILNRQLGLGAVNGSDVAAQQAALAQVEATLPPLQKALAQQRNLLATLTGRLPDQSLAEQFKLADLKLPQDLPLSLPSKLVEQRPDVRAAEANLHSVVGAGRRRDRQPVPQHHAERQHRHPGADPRHAVRPDARLVGRGRQRAADHPRRRRAGRQEARRPGGAGAGRRAVPLDRAAGLPQRRRHAARARVRRPRPEGRGRRRAGDRDQPADRPPPARTR